MFPYYLAMGMSREEFWNMDCNLVRDYRKADEIRRERENHSLWLQGAYIYDLLTRLVPALNPMTKKGIRPKPYMDEPYPVTRRAVEDREEQKEKATHDKGVMFMEKFMNMNNKKASEDKSEDKSEGDTNTPE